MSERPLYQQPCRLGAVSFLNATPLIEGLDARGAVEISYAVPSCLPGMLNRGEVDVALVPVIDLARFGSRWKRVSDACIGCDGETLTVRVFSHLPPNEITHLHVDGDSHTSVALAMVLWNEMYGSQLRISALDPGSAPDCQALLLIGDKVVTQRPEGFSHEFDLGGAWQEYTGLPFVFAAWATLKTRDADDVAELLSEARDQGVARAPAIAARQGPARGWPAEQARRYLTQHISYTLTERHREGLELFLELSAKWRIVPPSAEAVAR